MLTFLVVVLFIAVPVVEIWLILQVADLLGGGATGAVLTLLLLVVDSLFGAWLVRSQGRAAWARFLAAVGERRLPQREMVDGLFIVVGGILLLTPGFLTDIVGLAMLLPPSRRVLAAWTARRVAKRVGRAAGVDGRQRSAGAPPASPSGAKAAAEDADVIDGIAIEQDLDFDFERKRLEGR